MWTLLLAMAAALFVVNQLEPWGLATFGLFGWWPVATLIGGAVGLVVVVLVGLTGRLVRPR
jgi:hypothetical protein